MAEEREEYDLKESVKLVGPLYPVLIDAEGNCIDGYHRKMADPKWPIQRLEHVKTREQFLMARLVANLHRREVPPEEKRQWLGELAEETGQSPKQIAEKLKMSYRWVVKYIPETYKDRDMQELSAKASGARRAPKKLVERVGKALGALAKACEVSERGKEVVVKPKTRLEDGQLLELYGKVIDELGGVYYPIEGQFVVPASKKPRKEKPRIKIVLNPDADKKDRFADDLDLWFLKFNEPVALALTRYCRDKEVYWEDAVRHLLAKALKEEGYV